MNYSLSEAATLIGLNELGEMKETIAWNRIGVSQPDDDIIVLLQVVNEHGETDVSEAFLLADEWHWLDAGTISDDVEPMFWADVPTGPDLEQN